MPARRLLRLGRFGWKAGMAKVKHQIADALNRDIGVTTSIFPALDCGPSQSGCSGTSTELSSSDLDTLTRYIALLGVPARRDLRDATALRGETLFNNAGCAKCHTATLTTSNYHPNSELRGQTIHPYTDPLLHDMGSGLADNLGEGIATGAEWRTPPLWGIGLTAGISGGEAYLHDGRARNLQHEQLRPGRPAPVPPEPLTSWTRLFQGSLTAKGRAPSGRAPFRRVRQSDPSLPRAAGTSPRQDIPPGPARWRSLVLVRLSARAARCGRPRGVRSAPLPAGGPEPRSATASRRSACAGSR